MENSAPGGTFEPENENKIYTSRNPLTLIPGYPRTLI